VFDADGTRVVDADVNAVSAAPQPYVRAV